MGPCREGAALKHLMCKGRAQRSCERPNKQKSPTYYCKSGMGMRQRPTLPGRLQPSTIGVLRLNFCVRNGNRWNPQAITTASGERCLPLSHFVRFGYKLKVLHPDNCI